MTKLHQQPRNYGESVRGRRFAAKFDWRRIRRVSFLLIAGWLFWNAAPATLAVNEGSLEYPVKLAFLYNFAKFVEWPPDAYGDSGAPLAICIVGQDPFSPDLEGELKTRTVGGHPVEFRVVRPSDILGMCHIVFVPLTEKDQADHIVRGLKGILTVGETEGFAVLGGIINLTVEANNVRFEINLLAAERAGLKISPKLLSIAKIVRDN